MAALEAMEACLTAKVAKLLKQNEELLEVKKKDKIEVDALKKEVGQVQKAWDDSGLKLVDLKGL